jgi:phage terminase large subunit GpA-like protein
MRDLARAGYAAFLLAIAASAKPAPALSVSEWAAQEREVAAESGSPYPGKWDNERVPYLVEVMDTCGMDHPARSVAILASAQSAKSEAVLNAIGHTICQNPVPILVMLPSLDEVSKYNAHKLQVAIDATPALRVRVKETVTRDETGSTTSFKRFRGGYLRIVNAGSSKALQMISAAYRVYEEPTGYPLDVDGRGDPISQADARSKAWKERGEKAILVGTPGTKGQCRVSAAYEASDQRRWYVPCPHCGAYQVLLPQNLHQVADKPPHGAWFACAAAGCVIEQADKAAMVARGAWIRTYASEDAANPAPPEHFPAADLARWVERGPEHRQPGFAWWQAYSPFVSWDDTVAERQAAEGDPRKLKVLWQQAYGEAWEEQGEAPDAERLLERRQKWQAGRIPAGVLFLTGAVDVQGDRLEWAVYGWDRHLAGYHVARGVIEGDPNLAGPWQVLDELVTRRFQDAWGKTWPVDVWGVDSGFLSQTVYRWALRHAHTGRIRALDGRSGWKLPAIGTPKTIDVDWDGRKLGAVQLWPVGTWDLKSELYGKLRMTLKGPDDTGAWPRECMWFGESCDRGFFEQLTAEFLTDVERRSGYVEKAWVKIKGRRNEQHDLAVYALGLARHASDPLTDGDWAQLEQQRLGPAAEAQLDLAAIWAPGLASEHPTVKVPAGVVPPQPATVATGSGEEQGARRRVIRSSYL